ncbi:MAG TPA: hypothetical protein VI583_18135 [Cyclobacteriaceae bacterium]|nr:hypothetical protein [Cyclobacteriaceae bacterium]
MKNYLVFLFILLTFRTNAQTPYYDHSHNGFLVFHPIRTDASGKIIPWYADDPGKSFDHIIDLVWNFWDTMRIDMNGLPYYMNHQVWRPNNDPRGLGGDQFNMALSSWSLLYMYTGNERIKENMKFIADYYLTHSLSPEEAEWPHIPFPYNTLVYSGFYDGDMVLGKGFTQPDKAGNFGHELITLFKITGNRNYLDAAIDIANTLARHTSEGDNDHSPLPFKVNAITGETGILKSNTGDGSAAGSSSYTTGWAGTMKLFDELCDLAAGDTASYKKAFALIKNWMMKYPVKTNKWGPFFEDIPGWSDTQTNAVTFAQYMMERPDLFPEWKPDVRGILDWVYQRLGNNEWKKYGVIVVNEQTVYMTPGNSHTSRQAAAELQYAKLTGNAEWKENAIRQLSWATYMVDTDGKNCYPRDEVWLTDGYGDYVRHYLRAMGTEPSLAPPDEDHILSSNSVVTQADYAPNFNKKLSKEVSDTEKDFVKIIYRTFDKRSTEVIRMTAKPTDIYVRDRAIHETTGPSSEGWSWKPLNNGGVLTITHFDNHIRIIQKP